MPHTCISNQAIITNRLPDDTEVSYVPLGLFHIKLKMESIANQSLVQLFDVAESCQYV